MQVKVTAWQNRANLVKIDLNPRCQGLKFPFFLFFFASFLSLLRESLTEGVNSVPRSCFTALLKK